MITMGFPTGRILPLLTQSLLVVKISPRLDQGVECPAGWDNDLIDGDDGDGGSGVMMMLMVVGITVIIVMLMIMGLL